MYARTAFGSFVGFEVGWTQVHPRLDPGLGRQRIALALALLNVRWAHESAWVIEGAFNADRHLLTFINANHNAAAPHPAPAEALGATGRAVVSYTQHADPVWDSADEQHPAAFRHRVLRSSPER